MVVLFYRARLLMTMLLVFFQKVDAQHADFIGLNLLQVLGNCDYSGDHVPDLSALLNKTLDGIKAKNVKVSHVKWGIPEYHELPNRT